MLSRISLASVILILGGLFWKDRKKSCNETLSPRWEYKIWSIYIGNNSCDRPISLHQILVNQLRRDNRSIVRLYAGLIANVVEDENDTNLDYIFENIIQKVKFPLIQTDTDHNPQMWKNLPKNV